MSNYIQKISANVAENLSISYFISFITSSFLFLVLMLLYNWDISSFIELTFLLILTAVSGVIMRFLSGWGLILTYAMVSSYLFRIFSGLIKGRKTSGKAFKVFLLVVAGLIVGYGGYVFITAVLYMRTLSFIEEWISLLFGIWSLIVLVYLVPVIRGKYQPLSEERLRDRIKGKLGGLKYSIWSGYKLRIRKDYGKVYAAEYERYKTEIEVIRDQLSGLLLLPFTFMLIAFLPLMGVAIILWIRLFSHHRKPFTIGERILLVLVLAVILTISTLILLFVDITALMTFFNISYAMGIFSGGVLLLYIIIKS